MKGFRIISIVALASMAMAGCNGKNNDGDSEIITLEENTDIVYNTEANEESSTEAEVEKTTEMVFNPYEGMSDEEILDIGINTINKGFFEGKEDKGTIGMILTALAKTSGSEGTWSGMLDKDGLLYVEYGSYFENEYFEMHFTVNVDKSFAFDSVNTNDTEVDKKEFVEKIIKFNEEK